MTSEERREARYRRRCEKREQKKKAACARFDDFDTVFSFQHLYRSYRCCRRGVAWKASVQKYMTNAPLNVFHTFRSLHSGKYRSPGFFEFDLFERGKARHIRSTVIGERVVQRTLCDNALVPMLERTFIHDNGAAMVGKGYTFAVNRIKKHLRDHYRKYGNEGYVLLYDFSKFFDNVSHEIVKTMIYKEFTDERIIKLTEHFIDAFGDVGMGLGSQISQVLALASANRLDHFIKEVLRIKGYARYMDDGYLIHPSKAYLKECLKRINGICTELGIKLSPKKTQIVKLSHGFTWLKIRFYLTDTGRVVSKIYKHSVTVQRRKLKKLRKKLDAGRMTFDDVYATWQSWRAYALTFDAWHTIQNMAALFNELFIKDFLRRPPYDPLQNTG